MLKCSIVIGILLAASSLFAQQKIDKNTLEKIRQKAVLQQKSIAVEHVNTFVKTAGSSANFYGFYNGVPAVIENSDPDQNTASNADNLQNNTLSGIAVTGATAKVYIWDGNQVKVRPTHQEFGTRITNNESAFPNGSHATGVAGVIGAMGVAGNNAQGVAPAVAIEHYDFNSDVVEMTTEALNNTNYMISNHSYNFRAGWVNIAGGSQPGWYWYGYPHMNANESALHGYYGSVDENFDAMVYAAPQMIVVRSAGNDFDEGPAAGTAHWFLDASNAWTMSTDIRPKNCGQTGFDCLPYASVGKNSISVGSVKPLLSADGRYNAPNDVILSDFSSKGPTDDGRIKPDLVALGDNIWSTNSTNDSSYGTFSGTSFATPVVTGAIALLQEIAISELGRSLNAAEARGLLLHTANDAGNPGPDYSYGFGLMDAFKAAQHIVITADNDAVLSSNNLTDGSSFNQTFEADGSQPLIFTIAWTDPAHLANTNVVFNDRSPVLENDLDLRVMHNGVTFSPYILDVDNPANNATTGDNVVDNVEKIVIQNPTAGGMYSLTVNHKNTLVNGSQDFALVVSGMAVNTLDTEVTEVVSEAIEIYPTRVNRQLLIKNLKAGRVQVHNSQGQLVLNKNCELGQVQALDVSQFTPGNYFVKIIDHKGSETFHRFIKE